MNVIVKNSILLVYLISGLLIASSSYSAVCNFTGSRNVNIISETNYFSVRSNGDLSKAKRKGPYLLGIIDQFTGEKIVLKKVNEQPKVDTVIYFKVGNEFFKREYTVIDSRWFGFISDLVLDNHDNYVSGTDNSSQLELFLQYAGQLKMAKGKYFFKASGFKLKSNTMLDLGESVLKYKSESLYSPFLILGGASYLSENITLLNGTIIGNKNELVAKTEWLHGISIRESKKVRIENVTSNSNKGDGLYIGMENENEANRNQFIEIVNCVFDKNYRQGCSIVSGQNITFSKTRFSNTKGTAPQAGVDIEPDPHSSGFRDICKDIWFDHCEFVGNASSGASVNGILNNNTNLTDIVNIIFTNSVFDKNLIVGIDFRACMDIKVDSCTINAMEHGIIFSDAIYKNISISNTKVQGAKNGIGIYIIANTLPLISETILIEGCEVANFGRYGVLAEEKSNTYLSGFVFKNNFIHNNYHNIHIQKGIVKALYSGNTTAKVGLDITNRKYDGWTFGWDFSKKDDATTRIDLDVRDVNRKDN